MKKVSHFYLGFVFLILYLPIFYLIFYAFNKGRYECLYGLHA